MLEFVAVSKFASLKGPILEAVITCCAMKIYYRFRYFSCSSDRVKLLIRTGTYKTF